MSFAVALKPFSPFSFLSKSVKWEISVGLNSIPVSEGSFTTSFAELDRYGMLWGESLMLFIGQHHSFYKNHSGVFVHPLSGKLVINPVSGYPIKNSKNCFFWRYRWDWRGTTLFIF